jgi:lipopolysaccharide/colanic/teichoic acid biosynthesis glycosyltransferase
VSLDLEYVERQSIWLDIAIILRTLPCVLGDSATVR